MKSGRIILGAAAAVVTVGTSLAFNAAHKFRSHKVFGKTAVNFSKCFQCISVYTSNAAGTLAKCHTKAGVGALTLVATRTASNNNKTAAWHPARTAGGIHCVTAQVTQVTKTI